MKEKTELRVMKFCEDLIDVLAIPTLLVMTMTTYQNPNTPKREVWEPYQNVGDVLSRRLENKYFVMKYLLHKKQSYIKK